MESFIPLIILASGLLCGLLFGLRKRPGGDDGTRDIDGIEDELRRSAELDRDERDRLDLERIALNAERRSLDTERGILDRDRELLTELERRARAKKE